MNDLNLQDGLEYDTSTKTFWGFVEIGFRLIIGWPLMLVPVGVVVGAILGAAGIIRKKKRPHEPEIAESN